MNPRAAPSRLPAPRPATAPINERWLRDQQFRSIDVTALAGECRDRDPETSEALATLGQAIAVALNLATTLGPPMAAITLGRLLTIAEDSSRRLNETHAKQRRCHADLYATAKKMTEKFGTGDAA